MKPAGTTTRSIIVLWLGVAAILGLALGAAGPRAARARQEAADASALLSTAAHHAERIAALRSLDIGVAADEPSRGGLTERVTGALQRAGLPTGTLASLSPEAETPDAGQGGARVVRRRATLTLSGVTLPQVGRFLEAWRSTEPAWTPASIDLSPMGGKAPEAGGDLPLRAAVAIEALTLQDDGARR